MRPAPALLAAALCSPAAASVAPMAEPPPAAASPRLEPFPLRDVRLGDGPFREMQRRGLAYLLSLDPDRLLHTFRINAGLPTSATAYGGWEAPQVELRGHSLGHYLTACALTWEATGDERLRTRALEVTAELRKLQLALAARGATPGYLSAFPEELFDRVEARKPVWAPYYTLHKLLAGLLDVHRVFGDPVALAAAKGMAAWVGRRAQGQSDVQWQEMLQTEFGGMQEALGQLHAVTRDPEHLRLARLFDHRAVFDPLARGEDALDGLHANTQIPKAIGAERDCALTGEARYCRVAESFWSQVVARSYAIGGHSEDEHFFPLTHFSRHLGASTAETCNTYNMLKLSRALFLRDGLPSRIDFYERGLLNHILASNDPATGRVSYYVSMKPGAWRTYSTPEDSFWCCVGTGMENPARLGETIYARAPDVLYVNLFLASELAWREKGLRLRQLTRFPEQEGTRLELALDAPTRLSLRVRRPAWATGGFGVRVNGRSEPEAAAPGHYVALEREWRNGDVVELRLPMTLRAEPMPDDASVVALLHGPIVLAADLGGSGLDAARRYGSPAPELRADETPPLPSLLAATLDEALERLRPAGESHTFRSSGSGRAEDVVLRPFFSLYDRRHSVYLRVETQTARAEREAREQVERDARRTVESRTVDSVVVGALADEQAHELEQDRAGAWSLEGRSCRSTRYGGSWSYALRLPASGPAAVRVTYWGGETRRRRFEVTAEGGTLATQSLFDDRPGALYEVEYPLPERLTRGRERVRVGFRTGPSQSTGAVFEVRVVRPASPAP